MTYGHTSPMTQLNCPYNSNFDVQSDFVTIHAYLSASEVPDELKPYLSLYMASFFSLPVESKLLGRTLNHEEVVNGLDDETVNYDSNLGLDGFFSQMLRISIKVETTKYDRAIQWLNDLMYRSIFDKERLAVTAAKIQQSLPESKRDGNTVLGALSDSLLFSESSVSRAGGVLEQIDFNPRLVEDLKSDPERIASILEQVRQCLVSPSAMRFAVIGNVLSLPQPKAPWAKTFGKSSTSFVQDVKLQPVPFISNVLSQTGREPSRKAVVLTLPSIESAYTRITTRGIQGFDHPAYPTLRVTLEVLNATEGFLWRFIRGAGLAYGAYAGLDVEAGFLTFSTYRVCTSSS
ncbi:hypothetical protein M422DRAFT_46678 [Sphaerobolus stellatus SS14]|uniref:Uncharacterized protein n=1 Tax=Sphaerobolus stellatus (strain SS14) TaxID=990650 RepID=A0A0C9URZ2_SPHS4|nr:hypothetical protein M422DRAFT_46678 [Sphaerobolus stellatus SS14]